MQNTRGYVRLLGSSKVEAVLVVPLLMARKTRRSERANNVERDRFFETAMFFIDTKTRFNS